MFYILNDEHNLSLFDDIQEKIEGTKEFMPQLATAEIQETDIITEEQLSKDLNQVIVEEYEEEVIIDDEPVTVKIMDNYIHENGYVNDINDRRLHHEIYMSDARKVAPEKWKTVIRHPIKKG